MTSRHAEKNLLSSPCVMRLTNLEILLNALHNLRLRHGATKQFAAKCKHFTSNCLVGRINDCLVVFCMLGIFILGDNYEMD